MGVGETPVASEAAALAGVTELGLIVAQLRRLLAAAFTAERRPARPSLPIGWATAAASSESALASDGVVRDLTAG